MTVANLPLEAAIEIKEEAATSVEEYVHPSNDWYRVCVRTRTYTHAYISVHLYIDSYQW